MNDQSRVYDKDESEVLDVTEIYINEFIFGQRSFSEIKKEDKD